MTSTITKRKKSEFKLILMLFLSICCVILLLTLPKLINAYNDYKTHSKWIYSGGLGPGPYKDIKIKFINDNDWKDINQISGFHKIYKRDPDLYYNDDQIQKRNKFYRTYQFVTVLCLKNWRKIILAIDSNKEAIIVTKNNNLDEYCNNVNSLISESLNFSGLSDSDKEQFVIQHILNAYDECYILDEEHLIKYFETENSGNSIYVQSVVDKISPEEYKIIMEKLSKKSSDVEAHKTYRYLVVTVTGKARIIPIILTMDVKNDGTVKMKEKRFPVRDWLYDYQSETKTEQIKGNEWGQLSKPVKRK